MGKRHSKLSPEETEKLVQTTHFSSQELNQWYKGFLKDCPSGSVDEKEFCRIYRQFFPFGGDPTTFSSFMFKLLDTNDDGVVMFKEFIEALSITSRGTTEEKLEWSFKLYDTNHDGYISKEEVTTVVDAFYKMIGHSVAFKDHDNTSQMGLEFIFETLDTLKGFKIAWSYSKEIVEISWKPKLATVQRIVLPIKDGDGKISLKELQQGARDDPTIIKSLSLFERLQ